MVEVLTDISLGLSCATWRLMSIRTWPSLGKLNHNSVGAMCSSA